MLHFAVMHFVGKQEEYDTFIQTNILNKVLIKDVYIILLKYSYHLFICWFVDYCFNHLKIIYRDFLFFISGIFEKFLDYHNIFIILCVKPLL